MPQINESNSVKRHSRLGIASTIIGGGLPLLVTALFALSAVSEKNKHGSKFFQSLFEVSAVGLFIVGMSAPVLHLTGLILGIIGAFSKETKKTFPIAGIVLNLLFGLIGVGIFLFSFLIAKATMGGGWQ